MKFNFDEVDIMVAAIFNLSMSCKPKELEALKTCLHGAMNNLTRAFSGESICFNEEERQLLLTELDRAAKDKIKCFFDGNMLGASIPDMTIPHYKLMRKIRTGLQVVRNDLERI